MCTRARPVHKYSKGEGAKGKGYDEGPPLNPAQAFFVQAPRALSSGTPAKVYAAGSFTRCPKYSALTTLRRTAALTLPFVPQNVRSVPDKKATFNWSALT